MAIIKLKGITQKGKNRIREHGELWEVLACPVKPEINKLFIRSLLTDEKRWLTDDFQII